MSLMLSRLVCLPVEQMINGLLRYDPGSQIQLTRYQGQRIALQIKQVATINILCLDGQVAISLAAANVTFNEAAADVMLVGNVADFIALASSSEKASQLINSQIDLQGDTDLAVAFTRLVEHLDIDWEALITPLTGSLVAHQVGEGWRQFKRWGDQTGSSYQRATQSYLEDEIELLAPSPLMDSFNQQVDQLRLAADRLEARIELAHARYHSAHTPKDNQD